MRKILLPTVAIFSAAFVSGCFQREAPKRIPEVSTPAEALASAETVEFAHLSKAKLDKFPLELAKCPRLWKLSLRGQTALAPLSPEIASFVSLRWLDISEMKLDSLPVELSALDKMEYFYASDNSLTNFPVVFKSMPNLVYINLDRNRISDLCDFATLQAVRWLRLNQNSLSVLDPSIGKMTSLERLYLRRNRLTKLPDEILGLSSLKELDIGENPIVSLPENFCKSMSGLTRLDLDDTAVTALPDNIAEMKNLRFLFLYKCKITAEEKARIKAALPNCQIEF